MTTLRLFNERTALYTPALWLACTLAYVAALVGVPLDLDRVARAVHRVGVRVRIETCARSRS